MATGGATLCAALRGRCLSVQSGVLLLLALEKFILLMNRWQQHLARVFQ